MTDSGTRESRLVESLEAAKRSLERYAGTPLEQDYREMVARYELRLEDARLALQIVSA